MSNTFKWVLGIILGLVILAGIGFFAARFFGYGHMSVWGGSAFDGHPMMGGYGFGERGFRHPMMGGRGFGGFGFLGLPFFFLGGLLRLLFPLAVVALVAYFAYQQGKRAGIEASKDARPSKLEEAE